MLDPATGEETGELPLGPAGEDSVGVDPAGPVAVGVEPTGVDEPAAGVVSVTGQTVVETAIVEVTTVVE